MSHLTTPGVLNLINFDGKNVQVGKKKTCRRGGRGVQQQHVGHANRPKAKNRDFSIAPNERETFSYLPHRHFKHESMPTCAVARRATSIHTTFVPTDDGVDAGHTTDRKARALCHFRHAGRTLPHPSRCGQVGGLHVALRQRREQLSKRCFGHGASLPATFSAHLTPSRRG